jgi:hypothetical protein
MGPYERPYQNWQSHYQNRRGMQINPRSKTVSNESHPILVLAVCQLGDSRILNSTRNGPPKRILLEMGTVSGNWNAISRIGKLHVLVLTYAHFEWIFGI